MAGSTRRRATGRLQPDLGSQFDPEWDALVQDWVEEAHTRPEPDPVDPYQDDLREMEDAHAERRERDEEADENFRDGEERWGSHTKETSQAAPEPFCGPAIANIKCPLPDCIFCTRTPVPSPSGGSQSRISLGVEGE